MTNSTIITSYLGQGVAASRPVAPTVATSVTAFYYATDTTTLSYYDFNTAAWVNVFAGAASGLVLVEKHTASASAHLDFTTGITSTYDNYILRVTSLIPATDNTDLRMQFSTDGGTTFAASNYAWGRNATQFEAGTASAAGGSGDTKIVIFPTIPNAATGGFGGSFSLFDPLSATTYKRMTGESVCMYNSAGLVHYATVHGALWLDATPVNAVRLVMSSGNIASGVARLYGMVNT